MAFRHRPAFQAETLETRQLLYGGAIDPIGSGEIDVEIKLPAPPETATVYLDFGFEFGSQQNDFTVLPGYENAWPYGEDFGIAAHNQVYDLRNLEDVIAGKGWDYDDNGIGGETSDAIVLADQVFEIVQRYFEPFNVHVEMAHAETWDDVGETLAASPGNDAYVIVAGRSGAYGKALFDEGNTRDDVVFAFAQSIAESDINSPTSFARTIAHEAIHSFGVGHVKSEIEAVSYAGLMNSSGDVQKLAVIGTIFRGFDFEMAEDTPYWATQDDYAILAQNVGVREGGPAYVSGTSLHDVITLVDNGNGTATVSVTPYLDSAKTQPWSNANNPGQIHYVVPTKNGIRVEAGMGDDLIDASSLSADVLIFAGLGNDELIGGTGNDVLVGESGDDFSRGGMGGDRYEFGFLASGDDTIQDDNTFTLYAVDTIDTLDFSKFQSFVTLNLEQVSSSVFDESYQQIAPNLRLRLLKATGALGSIDNGIENVVAGNFGSRITGNRLDNLLIGGDGVDHLSGGDGNDIIHGGASGDLLFGNDGLDELHGERGDDYLDGGADSFADVIYSGSGRDRFVSWNGFPKEIFADFSKIDTLVNPLQKYRVVNLSWSKR